MAYETMQKEENTDCISTSIFFLSSQVLEAELTYKQCVTDAKIHQDELVKVKERIISHIRKLIFQGDTVLKEVSTSFWYKYRICVTI